MITYNTPQITPSLRGDYAVVVREDNAGFFGQIRASSKSSKAVSLPVSVDEELSEARDLGAMDSIARVYIGLNLETADLLLEKLRERPRPTLQVLDAIVLSHTA
jgi:hypothetical protein